MEVEKKILKNLFNSVLKICDEYFPDFETLKVAKETNGEEFSKIVRLGANQKFNQKNHDLKLHEKIWTDYSSSIAMAPKGSEALATAYGNRSAILLHLSKFTKSIEDIDRALSITKSNDLKTKLLCRKVKCLAAIGSVAEIEKTLQKARYFLERTELSNKEGLLMLLAEAESHSDWKNQIITEKNKKPQILNEAKKPNDFSSIAFAHDDKFGNHLIATKDIKPGEVIFIEKPYLSTYNYEQKYVYCSQCSVFCWAMIPCESCNFCMFCSEKCRKEAWNQYHNYQCIPLAVCRSYDLFDAMLEAATRVTILAVKEAGSISKLKSNLQCIDKYQGDFLKDTFVNGKYLEKRSETLYSLNCSKRYKSMMTQKYAPYIAKVIIALARFSPFFGRFFSKAECKRLMQNEDVVFIGSLMLKNITTVSKFGCTIRAEKISNDDNPLMDTRILNVTMLMRMICHSCDPNVGIDFHPKSLHAIAYALKPIKKNDKLFNSYLKASFYDENKLTRMEVIKDMDFTCTCEACVEDWPPYFKVEEPLEYLRIKIIDEKPLEKELMKQFKETIRLVEKEDSIVYTDEVIKQLSNGIEVAVKNGCHPSVISSLLISSLKNVFEKLYGLKSLVPEKCKK